MTILGIESSCDDTAAAFVNKDYRVLGSAVESQINLHKKFGGVIPEYASRAHLKSIFQVAESAKTSAAQSDFNELQGIAISSGPGLMGSLLIGTTFVKGMSLSLNIPVYAVDHVESHIFSVCLDQEALDLSQPTIAVVVSGGHTNLYFVENNEWQLLGYTIDDACGEAFDKVGSLLGMEYPGGPAIDKLAQDGDADKYKMPKVHIKEKPLCFSYSGIKTSIRYALQKSPLQSLQDKKDFCASFQKAAIEQLFDKIAAVTSKKPRTAQIVVAGGVAANSYLRKKLSTTFPQQQVRFPLKKYCADNGGMIAACALHKVLRGTASDVSHENWGVYTRYDFTRQRFSI